MRSGSALDGRLKRMEYLHELDEGSGIVHSVGGAAPITSTGGPNPVIGITAASESAAGSMSAADKTLLDKLATVTVVVPKSFSDGVLIADASINATTTTLHSPSSSFTGSIVGKRFLIPGAGVNHTQLCANVLAVLSPTSVQLDTAATNTVVNVAGAYGTPCGAVVNALIAAHASDGPIHLVFPPSPPGSFYTIEQGIRIFPNMWIDGQNEEATIVSMLVGGNVAAADSTTFYANPTFGAPITLNANTVFGSDQVLINGTVVKEQTVQLADGVAAGVYTVVNVSGAAPQTVTVDRAVLNVYSSATGSLQVVTSPSADYSKISGFTVMGRAAFYGSFFTVQSALWEDITIDCRTLGDCGTDGSGPGESVWWSSGGSYKCKMVRFRVLGAITGCTWFASESCVADDYLYQILQATATSYGFGFFEQSNLCALQNFVIEGNVEGVNITGYGNTVEDGSCHWQTQLGVIAQGPYSVIQNIKSFGAGISGIATQVPSVGTVIANSLVEGGVDSQSLYALSAQGTTLIGCQAAPSIAGGGLIRGCFTISETGLTKLQACTVQTGGAGQWRAYTHLAGTAALDDCELLAVGATNQGVFLAGTGEIRINGSTIAGDRALHLLAGLVTIESSDIAGNGGSLNRAIDNAGTIRRGQNVRITTGTVSNSGTLNFGNVTLTGATPVAIPFADLTTWDRFKFLARTAHGGTSGSPTYTPTIGTGVTVVSQAGDTDSWDWEIS